MFPISDELWSLKALIGKNVSTLVSNSIISVRKVFVTSVSQFLHWAKHIYATTERMLFTVFEVVRNESLGEHINS